MVAHRYAPGDRFETRLYTHEPWRVAIVQRVEPYRGRPGYYVSYPDATEQWHNHGGWVGEASTRAVTP